ncbi:MAG: hypothetical protein ACE5JP_01145 [Candidatus Bipolaricaulia bacterium]
MEKIEAILSFERETKNTIRYHEEPTEAGRPPVIGTLYLQKWALGTTPPQKIHVTMEEVEETFTA